MTYEFERDLYSVSADSSGRKYIEYYGFTWPNEGGCEDDDGNVTDYLFDEAACTVSVEDYDKELLALEMEKVQQYRYFIDSEDDLTKWFDGREHLPLNKVTQDTPEGDYWCYFEEE